MQNGHAAASAYEVEDFWDDLLPFIELGRVIPVVGPELLAIDDAAGTIPLYRVVADRLLEKYRLPPPASRAYGLYEAVAAAVAAGQPLHRLYRTVNDILRSVAAPAQVRHPLRELAAIHHFDLFVTTTPDDLLFRSLEAVRGAAPDEIVYAPKLPTERRRDIPEAPSSRYSAVFYLLGKADVSPFYAIHDEDALEFPYMLQAGDGPERMLSQMRSRSLLLIGCTLADWLSRFFIRLASPERLVSNPRAKSEFLASRDATPDHELIAFLQRFSPASRCLSMNASDFVSELYRRWRERNPSSPEVPGAQPPMPSAESGAIFISYASEDIGAAESLRAQIENVGGDIAWFDKRALKPGDSWERQILAAIQKCSLFLPLISANTERRTEGYFRLEWDEAAERARRIQGRKFIFPIVIDRDYTGDMSRYALLPDRFRASQYAHAPGGEMNAPLRAEIAEQLRSMRRGRSA